jgi:SAM-dependent methyltransferase
MISPQNGHIPYAGLKPQAYGQDRANIVKVNSVSKYYTFVRSEIAPLLPRTATRILDVGCGVGATSAWLKSRYPESRTVGLEGNGTLLPELAVNVDEPHIVDLNGPWPDVGGADLVLLLDVLEHLVNPEKALARVMEALTEDGTVIISLPNVAHLSVSLPLLLLGRFDYADAGILDRTHTHFFYKDSALNMARRVGLEVEKGLMGGLLGTKTRLFDRLTFGLIRDRLTKQYIFSARRRQIASASAFSWVAI